MYNSSRLPMAGAFLFLATCVVTTCIAACNTHQASPAVRAGNSGSSPSAYPLAVDADRVGKYPSATKSDVGYFYDDVLAYRVWFYPEGGGDDKYAAFAQCEQALAFSKATPDAEETVGSRREVY